MNIRTFAVSASVALAFSGAALAQGAPGGGGSGGNVPAEPERGASRSSGASSRDGGTMPKDSPGMTQDNAASKESGAMKKGGGAGGR